MNHIIPAIIGKKPYMNIIPLQSLSYIGKNIVLVIARQMMAPKGGAVIKIPIMTALDLPLKYTLVTLETPTDINDPPKPNKATANKSWLKFSDKDLHMSDKDIIIDAIKRVFLNAILSSIYPAGMANNTYTNCQDPNIIPIFL